MERGGGERGTGRRRGRVIVGRTHARSGVCDDSFERLRCDVTRFLHQRRLRIGLHQSKSLQYLGRVTDAAPRRCRDGRHKVGDGRVLALAVRRQGVPEGDRGRVRRQVLAQVRSQLVCVAGLVDPGQLQAPADPGPRPLPHLHLRVAARHEQRRRAAPGHATCLQHEEAVGFLEAAEVEQVSALPERVRDVVAHVPLRGRRHEDDVVGR